MAVPGSCAHPLCCSHCKCAALQFRKLAELETMEAGAIVDVIGIVDSVQDWTMITKKDGSDTRKRSLTLRDDSGRSIEVGRTCCWGCWTPACLQVVGLLPGVCARCHTEASISRQSMLVLQQG